MNEKTSGENRKHKDSLFVDYFSKDRDWKQHFLSLYNALHGTNLQVADTQLERVNLEQKNLLPGFLGAGTVSQGLHQDSLKSLNISRFSQPFGWSLPT